MIRVVLDTNIIVSALLQPLGPPAQVFVLAIDGSVQMCVSGKVYCQERHPDQVLMTYSVILPALSLLEHMAWRVHRQAEEEALAKLSDFLSPVPTRRSR
jgi:hypothetical protein